MKTICRLGTLPLVFTFLFSSVAHSQNPERRGLGTVPLPTIRTLAVKPLDAIPTPIDARRSLFVTDTTIVSSFTFADVMNALAQDSPDKKVTKESLFTQWWDTANDRTNGLGVGPNCAKDAHTINDFAYQCPRAEGVQAKNNPFSGAAESGYSAIALSNRFDLITLPKDGGADCGEYRIVFARNSGITNPLNRNLIIFEAVLPNPKPNGKDLSGCLPIAEFWANLSNVKDQKERAKKLHDFYFKGLPGFSAVVRAKNYGDATTKAKGQIRTNQFMQFNWMLREFVLDSSSGSLLMKPVTVKSNPAGILFNEKSQHAKGSEFRNAFLDQISSLEENDINQFNMASLSGTFDSGESEVVSNKNDPKDPNNYVSQLSNSPQFTSAIKSKVASTSLTARDIVARSQALSCAGCHRLSNGVALGGGITWPSSLDFTHQTEGAKEPSPDGGDRFVISRALTDVFLPHRKAVLENFIAKGK